MSTLEFEDHRPVYNWFIEQLGIFPSQQIEFDRLNLTYTLLSKRKLLKLVNDGLVRATRWVVGGPHGAGTEADSF